MPSMTDGKPTYPPWWDDEPDDIGDESYDKDNLSDNTRAIHEELEAEE